MLTEEMIRSLAQTMMQTNQTMLQNNQDTQVSIKNFERQMGQLSLVVSRLEAKESGKLPSQTELNPRETVNAITLRGGKEVGNKPEMKANGEQEIQGQQNPFPTKEAEDGQKGKFWRNHPAG